MVKILENPFQRLSVKVSDLEELQKVASTLVEAYLKRYQHFSDEENNKVDKKVWKLAKSKKQMRVYLERQPKRNYTPFSRKPVEDSDLQTLLSVGSAQGTLEDVMLGIMSPGFDTNSSEKNDLSGAVVLKTIEEPTTEEPFRSVVVKWMELDVRLQSMGFVKNRDFVYVESTGILHLPSGGRVGYHLIHSVDFSQAHTLPGRVRAKLSVCSFFRQTSETSVSVYAMGMMNTMTDRVRRVLVPQFVKTLLLPLKHARVGEMKKLTQALGERYGELKHLKAPSLDHTCISCTKRVWSFGTLSNHHSTCMLCSGYVCNSCKVKKKMKFVTRELKLTQRKVTFCSTCVDTAMAANGSEYYYEENWSGIPRFNRPRNHSAGSSRSSGWSTMLDNESSSVSYDFANTR